MSTPEGNINWGLLQPAVQTAGIKTAQPQAQAAPNPLQGQGSSGGAGNLLGGLRGLLGGLKSMFGDNPVSTANAAVTQQMQSTNPSDLANTVLGIQKSQNQGMHQQVNQAINPNQNNQLSIPAIQQMAAKQFPNNPTMQKVAVAQAAQESGLLGGQPSQLASKYNNIYGMSGKDVTMNNKAGTDQHSYASYKSPQESMQAYSDLMHKDRYAGVLNAKSVPEAAQALHAAGYATDPHYADKLIKVSDTINSPAAQHNSIHGAVQAASMPGANPYDVAKGYMGTGKNSHPEVLQNFFSKSMGQNVNPKSTPWCAAFANSVLMSTGHIGTGNLAAKSFLSYGQPTTSPSKGDIVVFNDLTSRNSPEHGHVGFVDSIDYKNGTVNVLGGNQGGQVSIKSCPLSKVAGFRVPPTSQELQQKASPSPSMQSTMNNVTQVPITNPQQIQPPAIPKQQYDSAVRSLDQGHDDYASSGIIGNKTGINWNILSPKKNS